MFIKIMLTLLVAVLSVIAIELARAPGQVVLPAEDPLCPAELKLAENIPQVKLTAVTREEAVDWLRKKTGATLVVNWKSLSFQSPDRKQDLDLKNISLDGALRIVFDDADRYIINARGSVIDIAAFDAFSASEMKLRVYDVSDLLSDAYWGVQAPPEEAVKVREARLAEILRMIDQCVNQSSWYHPDPPGGSLFYARHGMAQLCATQRKLVILQTSDGHRNILRFLAQLRQAGPPHTLGGKQ
jgi:hypothetical protein